MDRQATMNLENVKAGSPFCVVAKEEENAKKRVKLDAYLRSLIPAASTFRSRGKKAKRVTA